MREMEIQSSSSSRTPSRDSEGDGLHPQTDVPVAEMALYSVSGARAMGTSPVSARQKVSTI